MPARTVAARTVAARTAAARTTAAPEPRLRARLPVLWRAPEEVQVGTDPRWAVALTDLDPAVARALSDLPPGAGRRTIVATLRRAGAPAALASTVVAHLAAARLLVGTAPPGTSPDEAVWALLDGDGDGARVLERRARAVVAVHGLGRTGAGLAATLAAAGVGTVVPDDDAVVSRHDVGVGGLRTEDVGRTRRDAVARLVHAVAPDVRTSGTDPDVVVCVEHHVADPVRYAALQDTGRVHLSVVVREASVLVGPLVVPGRTACLRCVDVERAERDERWPALAAQLVAAPPGPEESSLAAVASALAAAQVLAQVDGRPVAVHDGSFVVALPDAVPRSVRWSRQALCGCTLPDPAARDCRGHERPGVPGYDEALAAGCCQGFVPCGTSDPLRITRPRTRPCADGRGPSCGRRRRRR